MVSGEIREKFKKLYFEKFDITLTDEEATLMATDLINLVKVLLKPDQNQEQPVPTIQERRSHAIISIQPYQ